MTESSYEISEHGIWQFVHENRVRIGFAKSLLSNAVGPFVSDDSWNNLYPETLWLTAMELPDVGALLTKGEVFGALESSKAVVDLISPGNGRVTDINSAMLDDLSKLYSDPSPDTWIIELQPLESANAT